jgi:hypothetical protein
VPELVPRSEQEFLLDPHVILNRPEHIVRRSVELAHCYTDELPEAGESLDRHRSLAISILY